MKFCRRKRKNSLSDKWVQMIYFINDSVYKWVPTDWYINEYKREFLRSLIHILDRGIAQLESGKGQEHELIEVD